MQYIILSPLFSIQIVGVCMFNSLPASVKCWWSLQFTVYTQIRTDLDPDHLTLIVTLKECFWKSEFWKKQQTRKLIENKPSMTTVENRVTGEWRDFKTTTMADTIGKMLIQVRLYLIFQLILVRLVLGLKQIPRKNDSNMPIVCDFWTKIWLKCYWRATEIFGCSSITF